MGSCAANGRCSRHSTPPPPHGNETLVDAQRAFRRVQVVPLERQYLESPEPIQHTDGDGPPMVGADRHELRHLLVRPGVDLFCLGGLATSRGMGTRAAGLRASSPSSTASASTARKT